MNILVCDDEPAVSARVAEMIRNDFDQQAEVVCVRSSAETEAYFARCPQTVFHVLLMDIQLTDENGVDLALYLSRKFPDVRVIFITGHRSYIQQIFFKLKPYGYLEKPVQQELLLTHLRSIQKELAQEKTVFRFVCKGTKHDVCQNQIIYMESERNRLYIYTELQTYTTYEAISSAQNSLDKRFVRCHKSYLVNLDYVKELRGDCFVLFTGQEISISRSYKTQARSRYFKVKGGFSV